MKFTKQGVRDLPVDCYLCDRPMSGNEQRSGEPAICAWCRPVPLPKITVEIEGMSAATFDRFQLLGETHPPK